jgi:hypothetical protein
LDGWEEVWGRKKESLKWYFLYKMKGYTVAMYSTVRELEQSCWGKKTNGVSEMLRFFGCCEFSREIKD